jgi:hypothetical protein
MLARTLELSERESARPMAAAAMPRAERLARRALTGLPDRLTSFVGWQGEIGEVAELVLTKRLAADQFTEIVGLATASVACYT